MILLTRFVHRFRMYELKGLLFTVRFLNPVCASPALWCHQLRVDLESVWMAADTRERAMPDWAQAVAADRKMTISMIGRKNNSFVFLQIWIAESCETIMPVSFDRIYLKALVTNKFFSRFRSGVHPRHLKMRTIVFMKILVCRVTNQHRFPNQHCLQFT